MRAFALLVALSLLPVAAQAQPGFSKAFGPSTIGVGSTTTLTFTIDNAEQPVATGLAFTDVLPASVTIATPAAASTTCSRGSATLTAPDGGTTISLSGGEVSANATCTVSVNVTSSTVGTHTNVSGDLTSSAGNSGTATADLMVSASVPGFTKSFSPSTVAFGGRSRLTFTIDNGTNDSGVGSISFTDNLPVGMVVASPSNATTTCENENPASFPAVFTASPGSGSITLNVPGFDFDGFRALNPGEVCTVEVDVRGNTVGSLSNISDNLVANGNNVGRASDVLDVVTATLQLTKTFTDDPVAPGGTVTLEFTLRNTNRSQTATDIAFSDDLDAALTGLVATGLPASDVCGPGSMLSGTSTLDLMGASLAAGESCTFSATLAVPAGATPGTYTNTTSPLTGTIQGAPAAGLSATDDLFVASVPVLTKEFIDDPVGPGSPVTLRFSITNTSPTSAAMDLAFTDELSTFLPIPVLSYVVLPDNGFCGPGSSMTVGTTGGSSDDQGLIVTGGELAAGASCTFDVTINLPQTFPGGVYPNVTSAITGTVDGLSVTGSAASDDLTVINAPVLTKAFTDSPVLPGETATLEFSFTYDSEAPGNATAIAFSDNLNAVLPGLVATGLPISACGGTLSTMDGGLTVDFAGGTLTPGEDCAFSVSLDVPAGTATGTYTNVTSSVTSMVEGQTVTSAPATADLFVTPVTFSKDFTDDPVLPGGAVTLEFTIANGDATNTVSGLFFSDNLSGVISGLTSTSGTLNDVCGSGSSIQGTTFLIMTGGTLAPGESCTFSVSVDVPAGATPDTYTNVTSVLSASSGPVADPASAPLVVGDPTPIAPVFSKAFAPDEIEAGSVSTLTFTIDNSASADPATGLDFTDAMPSEIVVADPASASTTCTGGSITAAVGTSTVAYTGGEVAAGATCTVQVDVTSSEEGAFVNTSGDLTSSLGNSGAAEATLTVTLPVEVVATKSDALIVDVDENGIAGPGDILRYTVAITNVGGRADMDITFSDVIDPNTTLVVGSVTTDQGSVTTGNDPGDTAVGVNVGALAAAGVAQITFDAQLNDPLPEGLLEVCNQGTVSGDFPDVLTDDPSVDGSDDPTCTPTVEQPADTDVVLRYISQTRPPRRDNFWFLRAYANNRESEPATVRFYFDVEDPTGATTRYDVLTTTIPGSTEIQIQKEKRIRFEIAPDAPAGEWTVTLFVGEDTDTDPEVYDSLTRTFTLDPIGTLTAGALPEALAMALPEELALLAPAPNPARRMVTLAYEVPETSEVGIMVYDALGRVVAEAASGEHTPGRYAARVDLDGLAPGTYVVRLTAGSEALVQRFTVVR